MKKTSTACVIGLMAAGCMIVAGAAQAGSRASLVALSTTKHDARVYPFANGPDPKFPVSDSASGNLNVTVEVDGWAFVDQTNCVQIGVPGLFTLPTADPNGTWASTIIQAHLGNGNCPDTMFNFADISFTWTNAHAAVGKTDFAKGVSKTTRVPQRYGLGRKVSIVDHIAFTYNGE